MVIKEIMAMEAKGQPGAAQQYQSQGLFLRALPPSK
jgi:hypothetical protein